MAAAFTRRECEQHTLQPTAVVHEVYLKLVDVRNAGWKGKAHFYAACAPIMRRILVDAARRRSAVMHGGGLSVKETAAVLKVSEETVTRDWRLARGWLLAEVGKRSERPSRDLNRLAI